ncbi:hypothetical protein HN419_06685 [Candidatus Woesearchaeota archaeon]|jgi:hypothetical protein|nr:hypothetical protein [Candidatus Woesearchaeota archaeon]MBT3538181.1 hypothetical protein [Candidatus Woesearchaeota archaeon]MBT4697460.1 hypothetical protein [Candidatus Woesearchaeota archaeon]MBT4716626.1 hypothetical protein [Candidatus Woesearchaeota archaeon]MBT7105850.1 hypothetical protein [Candidatus Woesearchaeota archaeon]
MWLEIIVLTILFVLVNCVCRLIFGSGRSFWSHRFPLRIHHGYVGLLLVIIDLLYSVELLFVFGMALFLSDAVQHFIVLPIWVGRTEFP